MSDQDWIYHQRSIRNPQINRFTNLHIRERMEGTLALSGSVVLDLELQQTDLDYWGNLGLKFTWDKTMGQYHLYRFEFKNQH